MKKRTVFLNLRGPYGVETVDEFTQGENAPQTLRDFRKYVRQMVSEYHAARMPVYQSSRSTREWAQR